MNERQQRAGRGILAAVLAVFVAALFHMAGGGAVPGMLGLVASLALAVPASVLLAGRRSSAWRLTASVALSQLAFHLLFSLGQPSSVRFVGDTGMAGMPGMRLHVVGVGGAASVDLTTPAMWAGHVLAAAVTIAAIRRGERGLRGMLELASRLMVHALELARLAPPVAARLAVPAAAPGIRRPRFLLGGLRHRGPPAGFAL